MHVDTARASSRLQCFYVDFLRDLLGPSLLASYGGANGEQPPSGPARRKEGRLTSITINPAITRTLDFLTSPLPTIIRRYLLLPYSSSPLSKARKLIPLSWDRRSILLLVLSIYFLLCD